MKTIFVNIGLNVSSSDTIGQLLYPAGIPTEYALDMLKAVPGMFYIVSQEMAQSETEPTLVLELRTMEHSAGLARFFDGLSRALHQDCIAAYDPAAQRGGLFGPKADAWGPFNPAYFISPETQAA